jgi:hypothetical protein
MPSPLAQSCAKIKLGIPFGMPFLCPEGCKNAPLPGNFFAQNLAFINIIFQKWKKSWGATSFFTKNRPKLKVILRKFFNYIVRIACIC